LCGGQCVISAKNKIQKNLNEITGAIGKGAFRNSCKGGNCREEGESGEGSISASMGGGEKICKETFCELPGGGEGAKEVERKEGITAVV